jgi:hypothetical protein
VVACLPGEVVHYPTATVHSSALWTRGRLIMPGRLAGHRLIISGTPAVSKRLHRPLYSGEEDYAKAA